MILTSCSARLFTFLCTATHDNPSRRDASVTCSNHGDSLRPPFAMIIAFCCKWTWCASKSLFIFKTKTRQRFASNIISFLRVWVTAVRQIQLPKKCRLILPFHVSFLFSAVFWHAHMTGLDVYSQNHSILSQQNTHTHTLACQTSRSLQQSSETSYDTCMLCQKYGVNHTVSEFSVKT